ncbi:MAG TPA: CUAEP/CCAEP-tail radical SAM protein [Candidatus Methylomirabilis sp.]|nr:CUAEP/CCAEP-tail radical SAM protein [Candidatus Methylomirabilis sp.]
MNILLLSSYELGHQPFGLASPAAWLRNRGHDVVCLDLSRQPLEEHAVRCAGLVAFYVPMHTAARLALQLVEPLRRLNPVAEFCAYGLYAPLTEEAFRKLGVEALFGGEFEEGLVQFAESVSKPKHSANSQKASAKRIISLDRQKFEVPDRTGLVPLRQYAHVILPSGEHRAAGYTEASRGCKHLCRHCPVVPVYNGVFRVVDRDVVLEDIRQQVAAGAQHITFGDPDFFNGIGHALPIIEALHREFPGLTYDATIKIEHLKQHDKHLPVLRDTGCLFVTSAVESLDDKVLLKLEKGHTRADFLEVAGKFRRIGLSLQPTFVPFTPWTTLGSFRDLLNTLVELELAPAVPPIQLAIRLLIPARSRLLELPDIQRVIGPFDEAALVYPWRHADPRVDLLCEQLQDLVAASEKQKVSRAQTFERIWSATDAADDASGASAFAPPRRMPILAARTVVPYLNEPWYC